MEENQVEELDLNEILKLRREKLVELQNEGKDPFEIVKYEKTHNAKQIIDNFEELEGQVVSIAGRIMAKREMGKASFFNIQDGTDRIQVYIKIDQVGEEMYTAFKKYDIGDIVGITGEIFKTHKGEISVKTKTIELLSKALQVLPEKWHGLKDTDLRYRQRYVDLIVNPNVKETFTKRSQMMKSIRNFLEEKGFIEVETPILNNIPGGAAAKPFITHHNTLDIDMYLRIAPELYLKRLIVGGFEKVFEIGRLFRNEGMSVRHNPEFTSIELYQAYVDYQEMMKLTENMIYKAALDVCGTEKITYQGTEIDLSPNFRRMTMIEAVKKYAGVDFNEIKSDEEAKKIAEENKIPTTDRDTWGNILNLFFEEKVEEQLIEPTFITDYPVEISPLTKRKPDDKRMTERFELFICGREYANAYSELNDPIDQKERFLKQVEERAAGNEEANMMDEDFINALEYGMPPTGGMGMGLDRLAMLLTDSASIRDVLLFPTMKPIKEC